MPPTASPYVVTFGVKSMNRMLHKTFILVFIGTCLLYLLFTTVPSSKLAEQSALAQNTSSQKRPLVLQDQVPAGSPFATFRQKLRQAIRDRNADFIRSIADPNISLTLGRGSISLNDLNLDNPDSESWLHLEQAFSFGCMPSRPPSAWDCPVYPENSPFSIGIDDVYVGKNVKVRSRPKAGSPIITVLSSELAKTVESAPGWMPIKTPDGKLGYVHTNQAFQIVGGYNAGFKQVGDRWIMTRFLSGE